MKLKAKLLLVTSIAVLLAASITPAFAAVDGSPALIDYQGRVLDANGVPFASTAPVNYEIEFRVWNAQEGGALQWSEKQVVTVDNGSFSVRLGEGTVLGTDPHPSLLDLFSTNKNRYLGVTVIIPNQNPVKSRLASLFSPRPSLSSPSARNWLTWRRRPTSRTTSPAMRDFKSTIRSWSPGTIASQPLMGLSFRGLPGWAITTLRSYCSV